LCGNTGAPHLFATELTTPITRYHLKKLIKFNPVAYDRYRREAASRYLEFLTTNRLQPAPFLKRIAAGKWARCIVHRPVRTANRQRFRVSTAAAP